VNKLDLKSLDGGHKYAPLTDGTNIVETKEGQLRLAMPVWISGIGTTTVGSSVAALTIVEKHPELAGNPKTNE